MLISKNFLSASAAILLCAGFASPAFAQMNNQPWGFQQMSGAGVAGLMQQVEHPATATTAAPADTLVCGGGTGQSTATGNSTCIILNNATGQIDLGQNSTGSQGTSSTQAQIPSGTDAALATLNGH